jgi:hypothetical protein
MAHYAKAVMLVVVVVVVIAYVNPLRQVVLKLPAA